MEAKYTSRPISELDLDLGNPITSTEIPQKLSQSLGLPKSYSNSQWRFENRLDAYNNGYYAIYVTTFNDLGRIEGTERRYVSKNEYDRIMNLLQ